MKSKLIGLFLTIGMIGLMSNITISGHVLPLKQVIVADHHSSWNNVTIDGTIGLDWWDGNFTYTPDISNDALEDPTLGMLDTDLTGLYTSINETGISIGLNATTTKNANLYLLFIDIDMGYSGSSDHSFSTNLARNAKFSNNFLPNFFLGGWGLNNWELYNNTDDFGSNEWVDPVNGYSMKTTNVSTINGISVIHHEGFIKWSLLYPSLNNTHPVPLNGEIRITTACFGGTEPDFLEQNPADLLPESIIPEELDEINNYIIVEIDANGDMKPNLTKEPIIEWSGNEKDNSKYSKLQIGMPLIVDLSVRWNNVHDHPNVTYHPIFHYRIYNCSIKNWSIVMNMSMVHKVGDYEDKSDKYYIMLNTSHYKENDIVEWFASTKYGNTYKHNVTLGPEPPAEIGYVGNIQPAGGFIKPNQLVNITVQVEQFIYGERVNNLEKTTVTLNYTTSNNSGVYNKRNFTFNAPYTYNDRYNCSIGPFSDKTNVTFTIIAKNNNTVVTKPITVYILIPPNETTLFTMIDATYDVNGVLPKNIAFVDGVHDILNFNVTYNAWQTTFWFKMREFNDPGWGANYLSIPMFAIMIDSGNTNGTNYSLGNIYVTTRTNWEYGFKVGGFVQTFYTPSTINNPRTSGLGITTKTLLIGEEFWHSFSIPTYLTGEASEDWSYYVMSGSCDYNNSNQFRSHNSKADEWVFGGGTDSDIDPNYCDLLVPSGGNSGWLESFITKSYDVTAQKMVEILAVGPKEIFIPDTIDPTLTISTPADETEFKLEEGDTIDIVVSWTFSDDDTATFAGIVKIEVFVDTILQTGIDLNTRRSTTLTLNEGEHIVKINVYDRTGNFATAQVIIIIEKKVAAGIPGFEFFTIFTLIGLVIFLRKST